MILDRLFPSMFHRRLLLLAVLLCVPMAALSVRMVKLSLAQGEELRVEARARLVRKQWTPAVRGSILDRKGRVLAQDRPSYDISVDFSVISGEWAQERARKAARRSVGAAWQDLSPSERSTLIEMYRRAFTEHLDKAWDRLAIASGVSRSEIDRRRGAIVAEVENRYEHQVQARRQQAIEALQNRGETITPEEMKKIDERAEGLIEEQKSAHVLMHRVDDAVGFACRTLAEDEVEIEPLADLDTSSFSRPGAIRSERVERLEVVPGLRVTDTGDRENPYESVVVELDRSTLPSPLRSEGKATITVDGVACHVIGLMRDRVLGDHAADPEKGIRATVADSTKRQQFLAEHPEIERAARDHEGKDRGEYHEGDHVGHTAVEASQEQFLRGLRGERTIHIDSGEVESIAAVRGRDVHLTMDVMLQARVQAAMAPELGLALVQKWNEQTPSSEKQEEALPKLGDPLYGAAVVLDIDTAEIIAMVSTPTFTRREIREHPEELFGDSPEAITSTPFVNRAIAKPYQPGSIVKPLILNGSMQRGTYRPEQRIDCTGHLLPNQPKMYRCWIYKKFQTTHTAKLGHELDGSDAIMASCNIFFFTLGRRLGPDGVTDVYREFGIGDRFNLGVGSEYPGTLGMRGDGSDLQMGDAIQMGIGQGPVAWTPVHAANAYATIARGGVRVAPRLILEATRPDPTDLDLDARGVAMAMDGLRRSVEDMEDGTGSHLTFESVREPIFNAPGIKVWGKTGTAAASPIRGKAGPDGERPPILEEGDHSWFVILVGRDRPRYVISVVTDFGGSGGKVSGPIANQIIHALIAEGYL